jgi:hypothetical protein
MFSALQPQETRGLCRRLSITEQLVADLGVPFDCAPFPYAPPRRKLLLVERGMEQSMSSPQLTPDQIAEVASLVAVYINAQREKALPLAVPLSPAQRASMDGFFRSVVSQLVHTA